MGYVAIYKGKGGAEAYGQDGWYSGDPDQYKTAYVQIPSNAQKGDLLVLGVVYRTVNILDSTQSGDNYMDTPVGWTTSATYAHGRSGLGNESVGSGVTTTSVYYRIVQSDSEAGTTLTITWPWSFVQTIWTTTYIARIYCYSKPPDSEWSVSFVASACLIFPTTTSWNSSGVISSDGVEAEVNDTAICISGVNSGSINWSTHQIYGNHIFFSAGTEIEDYGCGHTHGSKMVTSTSLATSGTASTANLWNTMTGSVDGTNSPAGSSIFALIKVIPWPVLKRRTGGTWVRSNMKRRSGGSWSYIDNGVNDKILKRRISGTWDPVSCLYIVPSPASINESTGNGNTFSISMATGNQVTFLPWQTSVGGVATSEPATWITVSPTMIHGNETISVTVAAQTSSAPERTAIIYMQVDGETIWEVATQIAVTQAAGPAITISITTVDFNNREYEIDPGVEWGHDPCQSQIYVTSNAPWTCYRSGSGSATFDVTGPFYTSGYNGYMNTYGYNTFSSYIGSQCYVVADAGGGYTDEMYVTVENSC